ncbi:JDVT-CTERM system glutamic-type intramembrane protease [Massilia sp. Leaf139]|uniref:JDVT-CTERM system glutamic-type intramembrane protease MrtJ n=1 Tax=Massilia sp. Leaf139 TaxID=1736272 RepID=UPI0006F37028|nr:JDVT-CTERM system glutamic-type intramembrane protease [Massilia sp. Leaf139]KQQ88078.1 hypothetical protein ASF77_15315 [Massilia sp. Leaf139]
MSRGMLRAAGGSDAASWRLPLVCGALALMAMLTVDDAARRLLMLLVLAPLLEEAVFRAGLQEALQRRWRPQPANAVTALAFGLAHALARADAAAFAAALPALLIGAVYARTGRLRYCVALHAAMNALWLRWSMAGGLPGIL